MNKVPDLPKLTIDRTCLISVDNFDDNEDIEYWRNTSFEQRLEHVYRLRHMAYGDKIRGRISRVIEVAEL